MALSKSITVSVRKADKSYTIDDLPGMLRKALDGDAAAGKAVEYLIGNGLSQSLGDSVASLSVDESKVAERVEKVDARFAQILAGDIVRGERSGTSLSAIESAFADMVLTYATAKGHKKVETRKAIVANGAAAVLAEIVASLVAAIDGVKVKDVDESKVSAAVKTVTDRLMTQAAAKVAASQLPEIEI